MYHMVWRTAGSCEISMRHSQVMTKLVRHGVCIKIPEANPIALQAGDSRH